MKFSKNEIVPLAWMIGLIIFVRIFIVEPFKIPSGSMIPTLLIGDHLFVAKASYDIRLPFIGTLITRISDPKRGDVVVFEYPDVENDPDKHNMYYIKRLMGVPGDTIRIESGVPVINGKKLDEALLSPEQLKEIPDFEKPPGHTLFNETLPEGKVHLVQREDSKINNFDIPKQIQEQKGVPCLTVGQDILDRGSFLSLNEICEFTIPADKYFFMGDNRDHSADSRQWGFADRSLLKGRALLVWFPLLSCPYDQPDCPEKNDGYFRWKRFGLPIK